MIRLVIAVQMTRCKQINLRIDNNKYRIFEIEGKARDDQSILHFSLTILYKRALMSTSHFCKALGTQRIGFTSV